MLFGVGCTNQAANYPQLWCNLAAFTSRGFLITSRDLSCSPIKTAELYVESNVCFKEPNKFPLELHEFLPKYIISVTQQYLFSSAQLGPGGSLSKYPRLPSLWLLPPLFRGILRRSQAGRETQSNLLPYPFSFSLSLQGRRIGK